MTVAAPETVQPAFLSIPDRLGSYGDEAVDLIRLAGREPDPEQQRDIDAMLSYGPGGRWAALEQAIVESRQNGKTDGVILPVVVFDFFEMSDVNPDRIVWTAHLYKTAQESFLSVVNVIESSDEFSRDVKRITYSHGEQGIELMNGSRLEFLARSESGGRGLGGKRLVLDEALFLPATTMGSVMPVLSARPDPQITYASSAAKADSSQLHALIKRGRAGGDPSLSYVEYAAPGGWGEGRCLREDCQHEPGLIGCAQPPCELSVEARVTGKPDLACKHTPDTPGCAFDREDYWQRAGHSTGKTRANGSGVTREYVRAERRTMGATPGGVREFGRERMGWHEYPKDETQPDTVDMKRWEELADPSVAAPVPGVTPVTVGIDVPPDQSCTSIAVAWWWAGRRWVMVIKLPGTLTAPKYVAELWARGGVIDMGMQYGGPGGSLVKLFKAENVEVRAISSVEMGQGVGAWLGGIKTGVLGHLNQPDLYAAQKAVLLRKIGDAVIWARDDLTDLSGLYAATIAFNMLGEVPEDDTGPSIW